MGVCRSIVALGIAATERENNSQFRWVLHHASRHLYLKEERELYYDEFRVIPSSSCMTPSLNLNNCFIFCKVHKSKVYRCSLTKFTFHFRVSCNITALISEKKSQGNNDLEVRYDTNNSDIVQAVKWCCLQIFLCKYCQSYFNDLTEKWESTGGVS